LTGSGTTHLAAAASGRPAETKALWTAVRPERSRSAQLATFSDAVAVAREWRG
jgi:hypothetical protein